MQKQEQAGTQGEEIVWPKNPKGKNRWKIRGASRLQFAMDLRTLAEIVRSRPLDYGCRAHAIPDPAGNYYTTALVTQAELKQLQKYGLDVR